jgi:hypothetical protein
MYHPKVEKLVDILCDRTQTTEREFFRIQVAYFLGVVASQMRVRISGWTTTKIPANIYAINLAPSGIGKGYSTSVLEKQVLNQFTKRFLNDTFIEASKANLLKVATDRAVRNCTSQEDELGKVTKEFALLGSLLFSFDSATIPAVKQLRHKLLLANAGSVNLQIDEIGANLVSRVEELNVFLELYDLGGVKEKLIKSSVENLRTERVEGLTPTNMLLFGTPTKLLDSADTEKKFFDMQEMGYARRCYVSYTETVHKDSSRTPEELLEAMHNQETIDAIREMSDSLYHLADPSKLGTEIIIGKEQSLELMTYKLKCESLSQSIPEHQTARKAECDHRYFKVLKLAGAYAFFDGSPSITSEHIKYAITLAEDSGKAFTRLMQPVRPYMKLAKYLTSLGQETTLADLDEQLPYMRGGKAQKEELINMATSWGIKNNHIIKKGFRDGVLFLSGNTIEPTNLNECVVAASYDMTRDYQNKFTAWDKLPNLFSMDTKVHWLNHHLMDVEHKPTVTAGYRNDRNIVEGFNLLVLDVDNTATIDIAKVLLKQYQYHMYTTKSHGINGEHRFRIIIPCNYKLQLDTDDYKQLMSNIFKSLPFTVDEAGNHRCKKWETNPNTLVFSNEGDLFDVIPYIPKTAKDAEREQRFVDQSQLDALERWVVNNTGDGNRNTQLYKYAMVLIDTGKNFEQIRQAVISLNSKLQGSLDEVEIYSTIMSSVSKKMNV